MKVSITNPAILLVLMLCPACKKERMRPQPSEYVNPLIGASTSVDAAGVFHGLGKTFPGATAPFGMVQISPNTITGGDNGSGYSYEHESIEGFAHLQMSGVGWYGDLGNYLVMPSTGHLHTNAGSMDDPDGGYRSRYMKKTEKASAGYYAVKLSDYHVYAEATVAPHSGIMRFTYPEAENARIQIDLARRVGGTSTYQYVEVLGDHAIRGYMQCTPEGGGWGNGQGNANYTVYFYSEFSKPLVKYGIWRTQIPDGWKRLRENVTSKEYQERIAEAEVQYGIGKAEGKHLGFFTEFETVENEAVLMKTGISFVSMEGARNNLESEINHWDFDRVHKECIERWDKALGRIYIEGGDDESKTVFYTALYHAMIDPRIIQDVDGNYPAGNGKVKNSSSFNKRSIFSGWDVFRSQFPLQTLINPSLVNDLINSLIELGTETGKHYLPRWELLNAYTGCMLGNPAISVIADALVKGINQFDLELAYRYAQNTTELFGNAAFGYTPEPLSISKTLEYGYTEWCMSVLAERSGHCQDTSKYIELSKSYQHLYDADKGWYVPKDSLGDQLPWPEEGRLKQDYGCIESNPYQQGWFVPHDIEGMIDMMGGNQEVTTDLIAFFENTPDDFRWNDYYNHANEPVHHVAFLFNRLGQPWLTQYWTRKICRNAYKNSVEGLVGNEDVGQMSAWYVLAATGLHPICPGDDRYEITSPVFEKIVIQLDPAWYEGRTFTIIAHHNSEQNRYIQSAELNGQEYNRCFILHDQIIRGGKLELYMGDQPDKNWGNPLCP
jgi:predicted alpha-1,2-mannosidase